MKKNVIKTAVAAVCVVAAGMGGFKAYNVAAQSETDMLLAENVDALSSGESRGYTRKCWNTVTSEKNKHEWYCSGCLYLDDTKKAYLSTTSKCVTLWPY